MGRILKTLKDDLKTYKLKAKPTDIDRLALFVLRGSNDRTRKLGERERSSLIRDLLDITRITTFPIRDAELLADGSRFIASRNVRQEKAYAPSVLKIFKTIAKHTPNHKVPKDEWVYNALTYRVRIPIDRDVQAETSALTRYKKLFKKSPKTPLEWAAVRAIQLFDHK